MARRKKKKRRKKSNPAASSVVVPGSEKSALGQDQLELCTDLSTLAGNRSLPDSHPSRRQARILHEAFVQVTTQTVSADSVRLLEIPNVSPLIFWKHLIRAIQAFHAGEDELCRRFLTLITSQTPLDRAKKALLVMLDEEKPSSPAQNKLFAAISGHREKIVQASDALDVALRDPSGVSLPAVLKEVHTSIKEACPQRLPEFTRALLIRARYYRYAPVSILDFWKENLVSDAWFWATMARVSERFFVPVLSVLDWKRFILALEEDTHPGRDILIVTALTRIISATENVDEEDRWVLVQDWRREVLDSKRSLERMGPAGLLFTTGKKAVEIYESLLDPLQMYKELMAIDPKEVVFDKALKWAKKSKLDWRQADPIAIQWSKTHPRSASPQVFLTESAIARNSFGKAAKHFKQARGLEPDSDRIRKLTVYSHVASILSCLKKGKRTGIERAEDQIDELRILKFPGKSELVSAMVAALSYLLERIRESSLETRRQLYDTFVSLIGNQVAARIVLFSIHSRLSSGRWVHLVEESAEHKSDDPMLEALNSFSVARAILDPFGIKLQVWIGLDKLLEQRIDWRDDRRLTSALLSTFIAHVSVYSFLRTLNEATKASLRRGMNRAGMLLLRGTRLRCSSVLGRSQCLYAALVFTVAVEDNMPIDLLRELLTGEYPFNNPKMRHYLYSDSLVVNVQAAEDVVKAELKKNVEHLRSYASYTTKTADFQEFFYCQCPECSLLDSDDEDDEEDFYDDFSPPRGFWGGTGLQDEHKRLMARKARKRKKKMERRSRKKNR